jgi:hypothetical protein
MRAALTDDQRKETSPSLDENVLSFLSPIQYQIGMRRKETRPRLRFSREMLEPVLQSSSNFSEVARKLGYPEYTVQGASSKLAKRAKLFDIDCSHFTYPLRGACVRRLDYEVFSLHTKFHNRVHRRRLIELRGNGCENCGVTEWLGEELVPDVHHKNEDRTDNRFENLLIVCPNCHRHFHPRKG